MDKITFEVIRSALYSIAREMKIAMMRTAASPIIHSGGDASAAIFDHNLQLVAQGNDIPAMLGSSVHSTRAAIEAFGKDELRPGDVIISNDIYLGAGSHLPDVQFTRPIFHQGKIVAYTMTRGHWSDVGGSQPTSTTPVTWDIFGEGVRIPPLRLYRNDELVVELATLIVNNTREPENRLVDIQAQYAGTLVGERRLLELIENYGMDQINAVMRETLDYSERLMRQQIRNIPDGVYEAEDLLEVISEGYTAGDPVVMKVKITVEDTNVTFDYTGTAPQVRGGVNCPLPVTCGATWYTVKAITDPMVPINEGCFRPVKVIAPEGTIVSAKYPASVVGGNVSTASRIVDLLFSALAAAIPDRVMAHSHASPGSARFGGDDPDAKRCKALGRKFVVGGDLNPGGFGARAGKDGISVIRCHVGNTGTQSVEYMEYSTPLEVESWAILPDSGGPGKRRGGCSATRVFKVNYAEATLNLMAERGVTPPAGLFGGKAGNPFVCTVERSGGAVETVPAKGLPRIVRTGDRVTVHAAGSGGYGNPLERAPEFVLEDVQNGYVSVEAARSEYGVVMNERLDSVNIEQTAALRRTHRQ
jgi:N-methylhydantoinase B